MSRRFQPTSTVPLAMFFCLVTGFFLQDYLLQISANLRGDDQLTFAFETALLPFRYAKPALTPLFALPRRNGQRKPQQDARENNPPNRRDKCTKKKLSTAFGGIKLELKNNKSKN